MGFTKERIEESLRAVKTLELEAVVDWVSSSMFFVCQSLTNQVVALAIPALRFE